jgi:tetratricopeptide (TPR) repeat protein
MSRILHPVLLFATCAACACGPGGTVATPPARPGPADVPDTGLPQGKQPAQEVELPVGTLVTRLDADQLEMVYAPEGEFSPSRRLERAMDESVHAFRHEELGSHPSGFHDLFGSVREPDPFLVMVEAGDVRVGKPYQADPGILEELEKLLASIEKPGDQDEAFCASLAALGKKDPAMPVLNERLAGCYQAVGQTGKAIEALAREIEVNPSHPVAHLGLAAAKAGAGKIDEARNHVLQALLYYPAFEQARDWLNAGGLPGVKARTETYAPRISVRVDGTGWVVIRSPGNQPWTGAYASCKAGFRYAPGVRMAFGMKSGAYKPSLLEEMVCLRLAADAYAAGRDEGQPAEAIGEVILAATREQRLIEAAFFEVLGMIDPDLMKFLPEEIDSLVIAWIEDVVLIEDG